MDPVNGELTTKDARVVESLPHEECTRRGVSAGCGERLGLPGGHEVDDG